MNAVSAISRRLLSGIVILLASIGLSPSADAQIKKAPASPRSKVEQQVGLVKATVDYGRPGVKGRKIFGGLEPYGKVWRTGANASSKVTFDGDVQIQKTQVPAGTYGLYTIPNRASWTIILSKNSKLWGAGGYNPSDDLARFEVKIEKLKDHRESLEIGFEKFHANGADLFIAWEKTKVSLPVFVDSDAQVIAEIKSKIENPSAPPTAQTFYDAGMFYYEKKIDLKQAATWIEKAMELNPKAFWYVYNRAEIAYILKDKKTAKSLAQKSLQMATEAGSDFGYIARSKMLLAKLK